jgi:cell division protein FtsL
MTPRPTIFVSAVTRELKAARQLVTNTLNFLGYEPVWQDIFGTEQGDLRGMLRRQIDECKGVVQLVGHRYGAEPPAADEHFGRVSYTQYEALYALKRGKKVWYLMMDENFPTDVAEAEPAELRELQAAYRRRLQSESRLYHPLTSPEALETSVLKLRDDLTRLRRGIKQWAVAVIVLLLIVVAGIVWISRQGADVKRKSVEVKQQVDEMKQQVTVAKQEIEELLQLLGNDAPPPSTAANEYPAPPPNAAAPLYPPSAYIQEQLPTRVSATFSPQIAFSVFGLSEGATNWELLGQGASLRSGDDYFVRADTFTPGFLYIFQVDSTSTLYWLFPANAYSNSFGVNPVPAGVTVTLPRDDRAYQLDTNIGEERIYAIYSATRWEKLEAALRQAREDPTGAGKREIAALVAASDTIEERAKGIARVEPVSPGKNVGRAAARGGQDLPVKLPTTSVAADGNWLMQYQSFRHHGGAATSP